MRPELRGADSMSSPKRRKKDDDDQDDPPRAEEPASLASVESYPRKRISVAVSPANNPDPGPMVRLCFGRLTVISVNCVDIGRQ